MVKRVKPDFKKLGPKFGKSMKTVAAAITSMSQAEIASLEKEIAELEEQLENAVVIEENDSTDTVTIGSKVKVYDYDFEEEVEYSIVGSTESDPLQFKISDESPIGKALLGKRVGDEFFVETPGGDVKIKIVNISK